MVLRSGSIIKKISSLKITLLSMLQNKLMLLFNEKSLTQKRQKYSVELILVLQLIEILIKFNAKFIKLMRNKRDILTELVFMFELIDIQIIISRKIINNILNNSYEKSKRFMKFLIKEL